jgi:hypothetical protein
MTATGITDLGVLSHSIGQHGTLRQKRRHHSHPVAGSRLPIIASICQLSCMSYASESHVFWLLTLPVTPLLLAQEPLPSPEWLQGSSLVLQCSSLGSLTEAWLHSELATSFMAHAPILGNRPGVGPAGTLTNSLSDSLATYTLQSPGGGRGKSKAGQTVKGLPVERLFFVWPTVDVSDHLMCCIISFTVLATHRGLAVAATRHLAVQEQQNQ